MPAITAGMAALAQLQAARPTVCSAQPQQHPQPSLTQDQISDLLGQVNALLAALQAFKGYNLDTLAVRADELRDQMAAVERRMPVDRSAPEWPWLNAQKTLIHKALLGADIRLGTLKLQELEMRSDLFSLLNHGEVDDELIRAMRVRQREIDYYTNAYKRMFKEPPPL
jgi:hypothetical protein